MNLNIEQQTLSFFLPNNTLLYFDITKSKSTDSKLTITLEEKNNPPLEEKHEGLEVESKGFQNISVVDFPSRGKKTTLVFRRRRWQVGDEILKRNITLCSPHTKLEQQFGLFLKEGC